MEIIGVKNLSFTYPKAEKKAIDNVNFKVNQGEFIVLCGKSGCGKTTLLRLIKSTLAPHGELSGDIYFEGKLLSELGNRELSSNIGFVMQNPENQIVTDKVWHELAFGLESLGFENSEIRARVSEMASFFGIEDWFYKDVSELSGGQKQILNLASLMVIEPTLILLDEPTSQLDPVMASTFLDMLQKINRDLGVTVILTEHNLEEVFSMADRVIVMDEGKIIADETPKEVGRILFEIDHDMKKSLPTPVKIHAQVKNSLSCPITVREGRMWLSEFLKENPLKRDVIPKDKIKGGEGAIEVKDAWFRFKKSSPDILKDFNLSVKKGELFCLLGGNGVGKTTAISLISGIYKPTRGKVYIFGEEISKIPNLYEGILGVLPQNPESIFLKKTVYLDFEEIQSEKNLPKEEKNEKIKNVTELCRIENLLNRHPYDLSGGEKQRAALAKILLLEPRILILDEPTKGMDAEFKEEFAEILEDLKDSGVTILMVSHDIEFAAEYADRCALLFDGKVTSQDAPREFFKGKCFYTTVANRMARKTIPDAVLAKDIILSCGGEAKKGKREKRIIKEDISPKNTQGKKEKITAKRTIIGNIFILLFLLTSLALFMDLNLLKGMDGNIIKTIALVEILIGFICLFSQKNEEYEKIKKPRKDKKQRKRAIITVIFLLILIPLTILIGDMFLDSRKYYIISFLVIIETIVPFFMVFEKRKPKARELVVISVLSTIAVCGRAIFFMLPQFKPTIAIIIISGIAFGGETGFLVGCITGFISNFFFGQGPWTPWQMFSLGLIGFISGVIFNNNLLSGRRLIISLFGFLVTLIIYGGIMNPASVIMWQEKITWEMIFTSFIVGLPFDLVHAFSTAFFLWFISNPMIEKIERIKVKYGLIER